MNTNDSSVTSDLFIVLGTANPQRFEVVWQMVDYLLFNGEKVEVCHHQDEEIPESPALSRLRSKDEFSLAQWSLREDSCDFAAAPFPKEDVTTILVGHGKDHLVDTLETLVYWLPNSNFNLQRITTWVDCQLIENSLNAKKWYECCFHFSDLVILDEFKALPLSWLKEFKEYFKKECYPCIIENTRKGRLRDMFLIMDNQIRRIAQVFEKPDDLYQNFADDDDEEEMEDEASVDSASPENEPYFERLIDGRRSKLVPDPFKRVKE